VNMGKLQISWGSTCSTMEACARSLRIHRLRIHSA